MRPYGCFNNEQSQGRVTEFKPWLNAEQVNPTDATYPIFHELFLPLMAQNQKSVAFVHLANKIQPALWGERSLEERLNLQGFTPTDEQQLKEYVLPIRRVLERCQDCYQLTQQLQASEALNDAANTISQSSLDSDEIIQRIIDAATKLMNADRSTLWLLDADQQELWIRILLETGGYKEIWLKVGPGYAGQVAATQEPLNIPFDLYEHPDSASARATDLQSGYRTYSLLCLPIFNSDGDLIGVTQLVNKRSPTPLAYGVTISAFHQPDRLYTSFDDSDRKCLQIFNNRVGGILQSAELLATIQQQEATIQNPKP